LEYHSGKCQWRENLRRGLGGIKTSQLAGAPKPGGTSGGADSTVVGSEFCGELWVGWDCCGEVGCGVGGVGVGCELFRVGSVQSDEGAGWVAGVGSSNPDRAGISDPDGVGPFGRDEFRPANSS
jgi:hypothetical protein